MLLFQRPATLSPPVIVDRYILLPLAKLPQIFTYMSCTRALGGIYAPSCDISDIAFRAYRPRTPDIWLLALATRIWGVVTERECPTTGGTTTLVVGRHRTSGLGAETSKRRLARLRLARSCGRC